MGSPRPDRPLADLSEIRQSMANSRKAAAVRLSRATGHNFRLCRVGRGTTGAKVPGNLPQLFRFLVDWNYKGLHIGKNTYF